MGRVGGRAVPSLAFLISLLLSAVEVRTAAADPVFRRGDTNGDGVVDLSDGVGIIFALYLGGDPIDCLDAADSNDSEVVDLSDVVFTLSFLFLGGPAPGSPGPFDCGTDPAGGALGCDSYSASCPPPVTDELSTIGHVLNRIGYGPTQAAIDHVEAIGVSAYIDEQLNPDSIDESSNSAYLNREAALFTQVTTKDRRMVSAGDIWRFFKGSAEPPAAWKDLGFVEGTWAAGPTGIGYGDQDDETVLDDMQMKTTPPQPGYASVYLRRTFLEPDPASISSLFLRVNYDDGFVAYLNGTEVTRKNLNGTPPLHTALAPAGHEAGTAEEIDISTKKGLLVTGENVLAIQVHNNTLDSADLSMIPELLDREPLGGPPIEVIKGIDALQQLVHVRGIYSRKQLQAVLGEFWDNHFTTNRDKVYDYLNALKDSDASDALGNAQASLEASQAEYLESQYLYDNALGNFGDLLLYSATSPTMLIYLDNVLNVAAAPNENYAREILELFAFGVDNRYKQKDIEQLAKCFTGWTVCKVARDQALPFPQSALTPPADCGVKFLDTKVVDIGAGWKYFKGTAEPSPDPVDGHPTTAWTGAGFDDSGPAWLNGSTGIGYGDQDDATVLTDMRAQTTPVAQPGYWSVYLRRKFTVSDPTTFKSLVLEVRYDDGFVAYLNGHEVARSYSMRNYGAPPARTQGSRIHEVTEGADYFNLDRYRMYLTAGTNVLAIQVHNANLDSSDLSILPRILDREILPGSVENGDANGVWTFFFDASKHDTTSKVLFESDPAHKITIPAGRTGMAGLQDALDVVGAMVNHPSTQEFISIKLIQKFVSDDITLANYKAGTAPLALKALLADAIAAWNSTTPKGNIRKVLEAILDPDLRSSVFWDEVNFRTKVKTPVEFLNSSVRVLDGSLGSGYSLPGTNLTLGMNLFRREEPDGYAEVGSRWVDTASIYGRITFGQNLAGNLDAQVTWPTLTYLSSRGLDTAPEIVDYFSDLMFQGTLPASERERLLEFLTTDDNYNPLPLNPAGADFKKRVEGFVGLLLSLPEWNYQ